MNYSYIFLMILSCMGMQRQLNAMKNDDTQKQNLPKTLEKKVSSIKNIKEKLIDDKYAPDKRLSREKREQEELDIFDHDIKRNSWKKNVIERISSGKYSTKQIFDTFNQKTLESPKAGRLYDLKGNIISSITALDDYGATNSKYIENNWDTILAPVLANPANFTVKNTKGNTLLHLAAIYGWEKIALQIIAVMVDNKKKIDLLKKKNFSLKNTDIKEELEINLGSSPLYLAISKKKVDLVKNLLRTGININGAINSNGDTPLALCRRKLATISYTDLELKKRYLSIEKALERNGAQISSPLFFLVSQIKPTKISSLFDNTQKKYSDILNVFLRHRSVAYHNPAPLSFYVRDEYGNTPLHLAVAVKDSGLTKLLLMQDIDINAQRLDGYTALHIAAKNNDKKTVDLLLNNKYIKTYLQTADNKTAANLTTNNTIKSMLLDN